MTCLGVLEREERGDDNETGLKEGEGIEMSNYSAFHIRDCTRSLFAIEYTYMLLSPEDNNSILLTINSCSCLRIVPFHIMIGVSQLSFKARSKFEGFFSFNLLAITGVIILAINNFITLLSGDPNFLPVSKIKNQK